MYVKLYVHLLPELEQLAERCKLNKSVFLQMDLSQLWLHSNFRLVPLYIYLNFRNSHDQSIFRGIL